MPPNATPVIRSVIFFGALINALFRDYFTTATESFR